MYQYPPAARNSLNNSHPDSTASHRSELHTFSPAVGGDLRRRSPSPERDAQTPSIASHQHERDHRFAIHSQLSASHILPALSPQPSRSPPFPTFTPHLTTPPFHSHPPRMSPSPSPSALPVARPPGSGSGLFSSCCAAKSGAQLRFRWGAEQSHDSLGWAGRLSCLPGHRDCGEE